MIFNRGKKKNILEPIPLCEGLKLDTSLYEKQENRIYTLILKGILVYLISAGTIGCMLTAAGTPYSAPILHTVLLVSAVCAAGIYYKKIYENIGGLLMLGLLFVLGIQLYLYINSGFYAVLNDLNEHASTYFGMTGVRVFAERIHNRRVAVTVSMCYLGVMANIVLNMLLVRKMRYFCAAALSLPLLLFPVYIGREPSAFYVGMLMGGLLLAFVWKKAGHYEKADSNAAFRPDKKNNVHFLYHKKALAAFLLQTMLFILVIVLGTCILKPKGIYMDEQKLSDLKRSTRGTVQTMVLMGLSGFVNRYENTGGMNSGQLGGVGTVNLDYNTDLKLRITPYSYQNVYLKYFTGGEYVPYANMWGRVPEGENNVYEALQLKEAFSEGREGSAVGRLEVENVAAMIGTYLPYYSADTDVMGFYDESVTYTYYPRLHGNNTPVLQEIDREYWLRVPEENRESIAAFCEEAGFSGTTEEIVLQLRAYYQKEIPYTLRPGATPRGQDFVNYFINSNRKGYCVHFASTAVLVFRYLGIPARYVEGYTVSYDEMLEGVLVPDTEYGDYYEGCSEIGETALVEVKLTDASAHAWVEIYDEKYGWVVVDVTPYSNEAAQRTDFWSMFLNLLGGEEETTGEQAEEEAGEAGTFDFNPLKKVLCIIIVVLAAAALGVLALQLLGKGIRYGRAGMNDRLILVYSSYLHKKRRKYKELREKFNYREQITFLVQEGLISEEYQERIIEILKRAGFSNQQITAEEFRFVRTKLNAKRKRADK